MRNNGAGSMMRKRNGLGQGMQFEIGPILIIMHFEELRTVSEVHVIVFLLLLSIDFSTCDLS